MRLLLADDEHVLRHAWSRAALCTLARRRVNAG